MFNFPKKLSRRRKTKNKSPYDTSPTSGANHPRNNNHHHPHSHRRRSGGSTVSLPTLLICDGPRSYTSQSDYTVHSEYTPATPATIVLTPPLRSAPPVQPNSNRLLSPASGLFPLPPAPAPSPARNKELPPLPSPLRRRPSSTIIYSPILSDTGSGSSPPGSAGMARRDLLGTGRKGSAATDTATSPVALPHKALALLGMDRSGFGTPASPKPLDDDADLFDPRMDVYTEEEKRSGRKGISRGNKMNGGGGVGVGLGHGQRRELFLHAEKIYFRPQSLCSSFSTASERTVATTITTMSEASNPKDNGTLDSQSTLKEMSMLNLDPSDDEEDDEDVALAQPPRRGPASASDLPFDIMFLICSFFSSEVHQDDLPQPLKSTFCPNCRIHALWSLALVSRQWSAAANQILYRTISLDFGYWSPSSYVPYTTCTTPTGKPLHTNTNPASKLPLLYRTLWDSQGRHGSCIQGIKVPRRQFSLGKWPLSAVLSKCPDLRFVDQALPTGDFEDLQNTLSRLSAIKRWTWRRELSRNNRLCAPPAALLFPGNWSELRHLEIDGIRELPEMPTPVHFPQLVSLSLRNLSPQLVSSLLSAFPPVQTLAVEPLSRSSSGYPACLLSYLTVYGPSLRALRLRHIRTEKLPDILKLTPLLETLVISSVRAVEDSERWGGDVRLMAAMKRLKNVVVPSPEVGKVFLDMEMCPILTGVKYGEALKEEDEEELVTPVGGDRGGLGRSGSFSD